MTERKIRRAGVFLLLACCLAVGEDDQVILKNGNVLHGQVSDPGRNYVELKSELGTQVVRKRDIDRVEVGRSEIAQPVDTDRLILLDGRTVEGEVTNSPDGRNVIVRIPGGGSAIYPRSEVAKIIPRGTVAHDRPVSGPQELAVHVKKLVARLAQGGVSGRNAESELRSLGIFAVRHLREESKTVQGDSATRIRSILAANELRKIVGDTLDSKLPEIYGHLESGEAATRVEALKAAIIIAPGEAVPLMLFKLEDPDEDGEVRSFCVEVLRRLNRYRELVAAYKRAEGSLALALAMAMGENGLYLGIPTLISALTEENLGLRLIAGESLKAFTGEEYTPVSDAPIDQWQAAAEQYQAWWREHEDKILSQTKALIAIEPEKTEQRARAILRWRKGADFWERDQLMPAAAAFREAIDIDPTYARAALSLAILLYRHQGKFSEAVAVLESLVQGRYPDVSDDLLARAHYHLGMLNRQRRMWAASVSWLRRAIRTKRDYLDAYLALGESLYRWALARDQLSAKRRRELLSLAEQAYREGQAQLAEYEKKLVVLPVDDLPGGDQAPYKRRAYRMSLKTLRDFLKELKVSFSVDLARVYLSIGDLGKAETEARRAIQIDTKNPSLQLLLALIFDRQGNREAAVRQYERVLSLEPDNETARQARRRLAARRSKGTR